MNGILTPLQVFITATAGWLNRYQANVIDYLIEQNQVLLELHGSKCPRLNDDQRRRLAVKAKAVGRKGLFEIPTLFLPDTILGWHRKLVAIVNATVGLVEVVKAAVGAVEVANAAVGTVEVANAAVGTV